MATPNTPPTQPKKAPAPSEDFRYIVRIANTDLDGNKPIMHGLKKIKGVGYQFASAVCILANVDKNKKVGHLADDEISRLDTTIREAPKKFPPWMLNRRFDMETGETRHLIMGDLTFVRDNDIRNLIKMRSYKGVRHSLGQPVRGQKTRSNFRRNKGKGLGVMRSKIAKAAQSDSADKKK